MLFNGYTLYHTIIMIIHSIYGNICYATCIYPCIIMIIYRTSIYRVWYIPISISESVCISFMIWYVDRRVVKLYLCLQSHHFIVRTRYTRWFFIFLKNFAIEILSHVSTNNIYLDSKYTNVGQPKYCYYHRQKTTTHRKKEQFSIGR